MYRIKEIFHHEPSGITRRSHSNLYNFHFNLSVINKIGKNEYAIYAQPTKVFISQPYLQTRNMVEKSNLSMDSLIILSITVGGPVKH